MNATEAVDDFLKQRRVKACGPISHVLDASAFDGRFVDTLIKRGNIDAPSLVLEDRIAKSVTEVPDYHPTNFASGVTVGGVYEGVEVVIPIEGNTALFNLFMKNKHICDGFSLQSDSIKIKQFDFARTGMDKIKNGIKTCVESVNNSLAELALKVEEHHVALTQDITVAIKKRREEILAKQQKDKDADPWG